MGDGGAAAAAASRRSYDVLAETTALDIASILAVPMSLIDGRPWVPTEAEADPDGPVRSLPPSWVLRP